MHNGTTCSAGDGFGILYVCTSKHDSQFFCLLLCLQVLQPAVQMVVAEAQSK